MNKSLEEVSKKYKLSEKEHRKIETNIKDIMLFDKTPEEQPKAIFTVAPPGSGKTGLNGFCQSEFPNYNLVIVNNDEFKPFHPKANEIASMYPEYYIKITNEESRFWTDALVDEAINGKYNILYEGTGRKISIFEKMIEKMKKKDYKIMVRAMAVHELNCLMSILERYEHQIEQKGWGRLVSVETFYKAYQSEMLETLDTFEKSEMVDIVEVYCRGKLPSMPIKIYSSAESKQMYPSAKYAVIEGRKKDKKQAVAYYQEHKTEFGEILKKQDVTDEEREVIEKIQELYENTQCKANDIGER